ncbi:MAG: class I SAM-dependent methyltransferase [Planctomycetota bacterium]
MVDAETRKERVRRFFTERADAYNRSESQRRGRDLLRLLVLLKPTGGETLLDVATGVGHTAIALAPLVKAVVGIDLTPAMEEEFKKNAAKAGVANASFLIGDAEEIEHPDACYEIVTCRRAIHHFTDPAAALAGMARVLVPDGRAGFVDMAAPENAEAAALMNGLESARDDSHARALAPTEWRRHLADAGFTVEEEDVLPSRIPWNDWLSPLTPGGPEDEAARARLDAAPPEVRSEVVEQGVEGAYFLKRRIVLVARRNAG